MNFIETELEGAFIIEPNVFCDDRGYFFESYNEKAFCDAGITNKFVQDNQSYSSYGVIRGLHFQKGDSAQAKLLRVLDGKVLDVVVDIRKNSPTFGKHISVELSSENKCQLFIPRGFAHGFSVLSETVVFFYKCDNFYNKVGEGGIIYNDPDLGIDWGIPKDKVIVADKDLKLGGLRDVVGYGE